MYVCICNALGEKDLKQACHNKCPKDGEAVLQHAGCQAECGQCIDYIENFLLPQSSSATPDNASVI